MGVWMASKVTLVGCSCRDHNTLEPLISVFDTWVVGNVAAGLNFNWCAIATSDLGVVIPIVAIWERWTDPQPATPGRPALSKGLLTH
jgi:hypothetical protein